MDKICEILGITIKKDLPLPEKSLRNLLKYFLFVTGPGGRASVSSLFHTDSENNIFQAPFKAKRFPRGRVYKDYQDKFLKTLYSKTSLASSQTGSLLASIRPPGSFGPIKEEDSSIFNSEILSLVSSGVIVNTENLADKYSVSLEKEDSNEKVFGGLLTKLLKDGNSIKESVCKVCSELEGSASLALLERNKSSLLLTSNTGSLYIMESANLPGLLVFASSKIVLLNLKERALVFKKDKDYKISQLFAREGLEVNLEDFSRTKFNLPPLKPFPKKPRKSSEDYYKDLLKRAPREPIDSIDLKRCTKCVLPETMPSIKFDENGVCNFCHNYKKITYAGEEKLKDKLLKYKKKNGEPDCILAFSGGRDSAYALHYLKKVLGMNPIAVTYNWGMLDDIGRRNQARMVGRLGVEHVVINSNIEKKRSHIKANILAWIKKPHLGMVVLFMAGDKPAEFWVSRLAKKRAIKPVVLGRGNELENTDFKWNLLGISSGEPGGVMHHMPFSLKIRFTLNSIKQYIRNPRYFNSAAPEIFFDYLTTYAVRYK
ncbi:MAG: hypothetical protein GX817_04225, partial [Elusimicrobia bacterium]|nr:hypothetical protein [Elusimicrobiota bacterium]